jgi:hypothetical protein
VSWWTWPSRSRKVASRRGRGADGKENVRRDRRDRDSGALPCEACLLLGRLRRQPRYPTVDERQPFSQARITARIPSTPQLQPARRSRILAINARDNSWAARVHRTVIKSAVSKVACRPPSSSRAAGYSPAGRASSHERKANRVRGRTCPCYLDLDLYRGGTSRRGQRQRNDRAGPLSRPTASVTGTGP